MTVKTLKQKPITNIQCMMRNAFFIFEGRKKSPTAS